MNYSEARKYIDSLQARGWRLGLDRMEVFLDRLGNPHVGLKAFHVAGTNGKGSVTGMIAAGLKEAGFETGSFFSPYVYDFRERIQINGEMISEADVARLTGMLKPVADEMVYEEVGGPTEFEFKTAMAFVYWKEKQVDYAAVEVGLGGRLDATNVIEEPLCAVITEIGLDHQQYLGDTLEKIAFEKAGVIKPGRPVVTGVTDDGAFAVIADVAAEKGSRCVRIPRLLPGVAAVRRWENEGGSVLSPSPSPYLISENEGGEFMLRNREVARRALEEGLPDVDWMPIFDVAMKTFAMPGRMEVVSEDPRIVFDGAHNEQAIRAVLGSIPGDIVCVYSCATGHRPLVDVLEQRCRAVFTAPMDHPRALEATEWTTTHSNVGDAIRKAVDELRDGETLLVTGSFFLLGEAKAAL
jgi:dihydrofolate synthase/folylpolyglutamate synthase